MWLCLNIRTGCSERLWCLHSWGYLKHDRTQPWETCSSWSCFEGGVRLSDLHSVLHLQQFCDSVNVWFCGWGCPECLICPAFCLYSVSVTFETWKKKSTSNALSRLLEPLTLSVQCARNAGTWTVFPAAPSSLQSALLVLIFLIFLYKGFYPTVILWRLYYPHAFLSMLLS